MESPCYAQKSGNTFYFRSKIPCDLRDHFGGLKEFRVSLKCNIKSKSSRIVRSLHRIVSRLYNQIRQGMKELDIEEIKEILRVEIRKQILHAHHVYEGTNRWEEEGIKLSLQTIAEKESNLKETIKSDLRSYQGEVDEKLDAILQSLDIQSNRDSVDFKRLRNLFVDLYLLRHDWMRELINQTGKSDDDFRRDAQTKLGLELFPELSDLPVLNQTNTKTITVSEPTRTSISPLSSHVSDEILSESASTYFQRKMIGGKSIKEIDSDRKIVAEFIEITGDIEFSLLTKKMVSNYIDIQIKLPPNKNKSPKYRDLIIQDLVDLNLPDDKTQTPLNINKKLTKLSTFGNWGVKQGLISANPFRDMKLEVKRSRTHRQPFTPTELKKILKPELYLDNTINYRHAIYKTGGVKYGLPYYWVFILGIFSGLRTNEIAQMRLEDIKKESNIWFLHVEESEQTRVKTLNAIRKVPVHPQLIELGFIDYVTDLKKRKKDRVFWELTKTRDGYAKHLSRHFNEKYLPALSVWKKNVKVLYCTRHTFINKLYSEKVDENVIKILVGHEKEFTMKHYGGEPFSPDRLLQEISKVSYKGIKWDKLKI